MNDNEIAKQVGEKSREWQETARETAQDLKESARDWTGRTAHQAKAKAREIGAAADLYLREYAWTTVAAMAVLAVTVGFLLGRKKG